MTETASEQSHSVRKRTTPWLSAAGLGAYLLWDCLAQRALLPQETALYNYALMVFLVYAAAGAIMLVLYHARRSPSPRLLLFAGVIAALCAGYGAFTSVEGVQVAFACTQCFCTVILLPALAFRACAMDERNLILTVTVSMGISALAVLLARQVPASLPVILALSALASGVCLFLSGDSAHTVLKTEAPGQTGVAASHRTGQPSIGRSAQERPRQSSYLVVYGTCCIVSQLFVGIVTQPYIINSATVTMQFTWLLLAFVAAMVIWPRIQQGADFSQMLFIVPIALILAFSHFATGLLNSLILPVALMLASSTFLGFLAWPQLRNLSRQYPDDTVPIFVIGMMVCEGTLGTNAGIAINRIAGLHYSSVTSIAVVCIAAMAIIYLIDAHIRANGQKPEDAHAGNNAASRVNPSMAEKPLETNRQTPAAAEQAGQVQDSAEERAYQVIEQAILSKAEAYHLTAREKDVLVLVTRGLSTPDIASRLVVSESTVKFHLKNIYAKCGVSSRSQLLALFT